MHWSMMSVYLFEDSADPLSGSIFVVLWVPGQKLQDPLSTIRQLGKHVGEGATPVNGKVEFPLSVSHNEKSCSWVWVTGFIIGTVRES